MLSPSKPCHEEPLCRAAEDGRPRKEKPGDMGNMDEEETPPAFCCPIGLDIMKDPVFLVAVGIVLQTPADIAAVRLRDSRRARLFVLSVQTHLDVLTVQTRSFLTFLL